jgi:MraZ protein
VGKYFYFYHLKRETLMLNILGEYDVKLDAKGRLLLPTSYKKQLGKAADEGFVLNRDIFEPCLVLYPLAEWKKISEQLAGLNRFVKKNAVFIRRFNNGATPIELDAAGRILIPKSLIEILGEEKELKVCGNGSRIELWTKKAFDEMNAEELDFAALSEDVMGDKNSNAHE